jgi:hypothetical protein
MSLGLRRRSGTEIESLEERLDRERLSADLVDVPAAVICAFCGDVDCPGCDQKLDPSRSGIVAIVAWERPGVPMLTRLWSTARATTRDADGFFELLPDGPIAPALRFAATCEMLATTAMFLAFVPLAAVVAPEWLKHVALDPESRSFALRLLGVGLPAFAAMLVVAHAAHGLAIDRGASRNGGRSARSRALRFGLYACGWDLVIGPLGALLVAIKEGANATAGLTQLASDVPGRATRAFLRGCYALDGQAALRARRTAFVGAVIATFFSVLAMLVGLVALLLS